MSRRTAICAMVFLCMCITIGILPTRAVASTSGTWEENIQWFFDSESHTLTISGSGEMPNAEHEGWAAWGNLAEEIHYIAIAEGITSIGDFAFAGCIQLKEITIPKTVTRIGESAFERTSLGHIDLHDGITYIGPSAFEWSALEEIIIPAGVTALNFGVFRECGNLKSVVLPEGLTTIDGDAFTDCTSLQSIIIPDSVTVMEGAFLRCSALEQITLGKNVSFISKSCFQDCTALREISIPDSVKAIYSWAFQNCTSLEKVTIGAGVEEISTNAFWGCNTLRTFDASAQNQVFSSDAAGVIYSKDQTQLVRFPTGFVGQYSVLDGTQMICREAGYECTGLTGLIVPDSVTEIKHDAFTSCTALKDLVLGNGLVHIYSGAFAECVSLESVIFPATLEQLDNRAFSGCTSLRTIEFCGSFPLFESFVFSQVNANAYYPKGDTTWDVDLSQISDKIQWGPICTDGHIFESTEAVPPSCDISGKTESTYCSICGYVSVYSEIVPATGHTYGPWKYITSAGTPENERIVVRACEICGYEHSEYAFNVDSSLLPEAPSGATEPDATQPDAPTKAPAKLDAISILIIVIAVVAACFVGVEIYLMRKKKKAK